MLYVCLQRLTTLPYYYKSINSTIMKKYNLLFASLLFLFPNETIAQERAIIKIDTDRAIDQINPHLYQVQAFF